MRLGPSLHLEFGLESLDTDTGVVGWATGMWREASIDDGAWVQALAGCVAARRFVRPFAMGVQAPLDFVLLES